ncbi:DUF4845 domain-containing protein [Salinibius halmophilus]|uniref:DUF4845 domain-containing protein n=1 Tax=Salinibius halmophilus TaxID=1853216 RepID=UPI000E670B62|nr:DUF4845 domain-containing protein [Salinibius halmophilus]
MSKQRGFSLYAIAFWIALASFAGLLFVKFMPIYADQFYLNGFFEDVIEESYAEDFGKNELLTRIQRRMQINNLDNIDLKDVTKFDGEQIIVEYTVQTHIIYNIDAVVSFSKTYNWNPN